MIFSYQDLLSRVYATRVADNLPVCIKRVGTLSEEIRFLRAFQGGYGKLDPANHCVPLLECFTDGKSGNMAYMVMPALHPVNSETLKTVGDLVEFISQMLLVCSIRSRLCWLFHPTGLFCT